MSPKVKSEADWDLVPIKIEIVSQLQGSRNPHLEKQDQL